MPTNKNIKNWDIFCNIVDNFGDIGVCWRLSRQLANEYHLNIRLFIDDFDVASNIIPNLDAAQAIQTIEGVEIQAWPAVPISLPNVVIENFSCNLPATYIEQLTTHNQSCNQNKQIIWINLEYLSAEQWVEDCHLLPSTHPTLGYTRYFFYPGFNSQTGGLLRELPLINARKQFTNSATANKMYWEKLLQEKQHNTFHRSTKLSLFCYPEADIESLISHLASAQQHTSLLMPYNTDIKSLNNIINTRQFLLENTLTINNISLYIIPFLSQNEYDQLLWACDLNFVRGEDSWIRAIWAGKPFIWQPYLQTHNTHIEKLNAFLEQYAPKNKKLNQLIQQAHHIWSNAAVTPNPNFWDSVFNALESWQSHSAQYSNHLANQTDLSAQLVTSANKLHTKISV